jgi:predicted HNH restriction endonuclease
MTRRIIKENLQQVHARFRTTKKWKLFRQELIEKRGPACACCGMKKKPRYIQAHHLFPNQYEDLTPEKFALLCPSCHDEVERLSKRLRGKNKGTITSLDEWMALYGCFLPQYE